MSFNGLNGDLPQFPHVWKPESLDHGTSVWKGGSYFYVAAGYNSAPFALKEPGVTEARHFTDLVTLANFLTLNGYTPEPTDD